MNWIILTVIGVALIAAVTAGEAFTAGSFPGPVIAAAKAIAKQEGWGVPGARPTRNNNPGDLRDWPPGFPRDAEGFTIFPSADAGWRNLYIDVQRHMAANPEQTVTDWIATYAEVAGQELDQYAGAVAEALGIAPSDPLGSVALG